MADVEDTGEASLNEAAVRRFDPYLKELVDTAKYVALYSFVNNVWTKTNIEGSLFVYARSGEPKYNIVVLNRLDTKNLVQPITPELDLQRNEPYLLYRNSEGSIFGIWFFDVADCLRIAALVDKLVLSIQSENTIKMSSSNGEEIDIFKMLTKAQEAFSSKDSKKETTGGGGEGTSRSVAEFFAKAGSSAPSESFLPRPKHLPESGPGFLQQLKSNPVHSVEHIEKQQRVVTPHSAETIVDPLKQLFQLNPSGVDAKPVESSKPISIPGSNGLYKRMSYHEDTYTTSNNGGSGFKTPPAQPAFSFDDDRKPDLMPPAMFTPRADVVHLPPARAPPPPEPLTRNQLLQAFDYLLRNDAEFMTKLHEAYVKSLTDKIL